jgi:hypothetical protein
MYKDPSKPVFIIIFYWYVNFYARMRFSKCLNPDSTKKTRHDPDPQQWPILIYLQYSTVLYYEILA